MDGSPAAERSLELADEAMGAIDLDGVITHLSAAVRGFTDGGDPCRAGAGLRPAGRHDGAPAAVHGGQGLVRPCRAAGGRPRRRASSRGGWPSRRWAATSTIPTVLLPEAELALDRARRFGDLDLETKALADGGLAHVQVGDVAGGHGDARRGDGARVRRRPAGPAPRKSVCSFFTACYYAADFERFGVVERRCSAGTG